jgi:4-hydroxyphenylpyruvate dioxygenase
MAAHINRLVNTKTDKFQMLKFDHLEVTTGDAVSTTKIFKRGLGMELVAQSLNETGNYTYASYVLKTHDVKIIVTAPYLSQSKRPEDHPPNPKYDPERARRFFNRHGLGVSACGVEVVDAAEAYNITTQNGAKGILEPTVLLDNNGGKVVIAEIDLYSDLTSDDPLHASETVIRFIQYSNFQGHFLPGYRPVEDPRPLDYGIIRIDHVVGNVFNMDNVVNQLKKWIGFHTFAKFSKEEIQTPWTSLNSEVLASNNERVLFPINESAPGKKESQITEYLKAYNGPGVQHIAMKTNNVLAAVKVMSENSDCGFEFMKTPLQYYHSPEIAKMMKENLTEEEADAVIELGILIDKDDEGILLQIFTKPLFDRATVFIEIIQRKCMGETIDIPGCGGFGKGNFKAPFEAIERLQEARGGLLDAAT